MSSTRAKEGTVTFRARRLLSALLLGLVGLPVVVVSVLAFNVFPALANTTPAPTTQTFNYTGSTQTFIVPANVVGAISFTVKGGGGGAGGNEFFTLGGAGGGGGLTSGTVSVPSNTVFSIYVGGGGGGGAADNIDNYYDEGGGGGGGGSYSAVASSTACSSGSGSYCFISGGGGGGGGALAGVGGTGGAAGASGTSTSGATGTVAGAGGGGGSSLSAGGDGTSSTGSTGPEVASLGGPAGNPTSGVAPTAGTGGNAGGSEGSEDGGGGGGGSGFAGGGGGASGCGTSSGNCGGSGGGGGGSYIDTLDVSNDPVPSTTANGGAAAPGSSDSTPIGGAGADGSVTVTYTLGITPSITSAASANFIAGSASTYTVTTAGWPNPTLSIVSGSIPTGVTLVSNGDGTATISGTPTGAPGLYTFAIQASNGESPDATQSFTLGVDQAVSITSAVNTSFTYGTVGTFDFSATGFPSPTFSLDSGSGPLPTGVGLSSSGVLSGTPTQAGSFSLLIDASNGVGTEAQQDFTLNVNQAPTIASNASASFTEGTSGSFTIISTGSPLPSLSAGSAVLPTGVTFVANGNGTATLSGTATVSGVFRFTITATNGVSPDGTQSFTLTVDTSSGGGGGGGVSSGGGGGGGSPPTVVIPTPVVTPPAGDVPTNPDGSCPSGYVSDPFVTGYCMVNPVTPIVISPTPPTPAVVPTPPPSSALVRGFSKMLNVTTSVDQGGLLESVSNGILNSLNVTTSFTTNGVVTGTMTIAVEKNVAKVHEATGSKLTKTVIHYIGVVRVDEPDLTMTLTKISDVKLGVNGAVKGVASGVADKVSTVVKKHKGRTFTSKIVHKTNVHFDWSVSE